ncbi:hypothetical protein B296_00017564 [Ensete ventricosum]|uniref:Ribosomal RNA-processing protein 42 n=1 Tax=Ensete ventricosum TaxID=4639 RepID=A0A427AJP1_ENSVE|nr:hypothetical protein B296_00017564 [Ensete ventricosum]
METRLLTRLQALVSLSLSPLPGRPLTRLCCPAPTKCSFSSHRRRIHSSLSPLDPRCLAVCRSDVFAAASCSTAASKRTLWFGFLFATGWGGDLAHTACSSPPSRLRISLSHRRTLVGSATVIEGEKHFIRGGIAQDLRTDGRQRLHYRPISVETGVIPQVKKLGKPHPLQPDKGKCMSGAGIDLSSLVIVEGKVCWDLYIDGLVVSSDGNLLDALAAAIKVGRHYIVDATSEEESQMSSAVSISVNQHGHICGLTKRGGAGLDPSVILDMISVAKHVGEQLMSILDSEIAAAEASAEDQ